MQPDEHFHARAWLDRHGLTARRLAELTGYSEPAVYWFLQGKTPPMRNAKGGHTRDRRIKAWVWHRFRLACAAVDHQLRTGKTFAW